MSIVSDVKVELDRFENLFAKAKANTAVLTTSPDAIQAHETVVTSLFTSLTNAVRNSLDEFESLFVKEKTVVLATANTVVPVATADFGAAMDKVANVVLNEANTVAPIVEKEVKAAVTVVANVVISNTVSEPVAAAVTEVVANTVANVAANTVTEVAVAVANVVTTSPAEVANTVSADVVLAELELSTLGKSPYVAAILAEASNGAIKSLDEVEAAYTKVQAAAPSVSTESFISKIESEIKKVL